MGAAYSPTDPQRRFVLLGQNGTFGGVAIIEGPARQFRIAAGAAVGLPEEDTYVDNLGSIVAYRDLNGGEVVAVTLDGVLYTSLDGGASWSEGPSGLELSDLVADPTTAGRLYAAGGAGVLVSNDAGETFQVIAGSPKSVQRLRFEPATKALYATVWRADGAGIWRFADGAWAHVLGEDKAFDVAIDPDDPAHLVAVTNDHPFHDVVRSPGVLVSHDGGATWAPANDGLPLLRVSAVAFDPADPGRLVIGSFGRGFFTART